MFNELNCGVTKGTSTINHETKINYTYVHRYTHTLMCIQPYAPFSAFDRGMGYKGSLFGWAAISQLTLKLQWIFWSYYVFG